jgi:hypothetical protein
MDYIEQFTDRFAHFELSQYHNRLHEIFESLLSTVTHDIPKHEQENDKGGKTNTKSY